MKVTFIYPDILECVPNYKGAFYTGLALLSAVLKKAGHTTSLIHITDFNYNESDLNKDLHCQKPDLIAFSSTTSGYPFVKRFAAECRRSFSSIPVIYGGIHPILQSEESILTPGVNMICVGEGEYCLRDVCDAIENKSSLSSIGNLWIRSGNEIIRNQVRPLISNLDELPPPDRELYDYPNLIFEREGEATFVASRGCPFSCTYCANKSLRDIHESRGSYVRFRSIDNLIREISDVKHCYSFIKRLHFDDDILFLKREWAKEFVSRYPQEINLPFCCNIHPLLCTPENIELLSLAGCNELRIGLESGNEEIRKAVLNRHMSNQKIIEAFKLARSFGIKVKSFNMVGIPHEKAVNVIDTIKLNALAQVDEMQHSIYQPYPGTALNELCKKENLISAQIATSFYTKSVLNLPDLSNAQISMFQRFFEVFVAVYRGIYQLPAVAAKPTSYLLTLLLSRKHSPLLIKIIRPIAHVIALILKKLKRTTHQLLPTEMEL